MDIWVAQAPERERAAREQSEEERRRYERIYQGIAGIYALRPSQDAWPDSATSWG